MALFGFFKKKICMDPSKFEGLVYCYPLKNKKIKFGTELVVDKDFVCVVGKNGKVLDSFSAPLNFLTIATMPLSCKKFKIHKEDSNGHIKKDFKCNVYFVCLKNQTGKFQTFERAELGSRNLGYFNCGVSFDVNYTIANTEMFMQFLLGEFSYIKNKEAEKIVKIYFADCALAVLQKFNFPLNDIINCELSVLEIFNREMILRLKKIGIEIENLFNIKFALPKKHMAKYEKVLAKNAENSKDLVVKNNFNGKRFDGENCDVIQGLEQNAIECENNVGEENKKQQTLLQNDESGLIENCKSGNDVFEKQNNCELGNFDNDAFEEGKSKANKKHKKEKKNKKAVVVDVSSIQNLINDENKEKCVLDNSTNDEDANTNNNQAICLGFEQSVSNNQESFNNDAFDVDNYVPFGSFHIENLKQSESQKDVLKNQNVEKLLKKDKVEEYNVLQTNMQEQKQNEEICFVDNNVGDFESGNFDYVEKLDSQEDFDEKNLNINDQDMFVDLDLDTASFKAEDNDVSICPKCYSSNAKNAVFCNMCGTKLK